MRQFSIIIGCVLMIACGDKDSGSADESCTVIDNGDGTATMTCPDGTSADLATDDALSSLDADADAATYNLPGDQNPLVGQPNVFLRVYEK